MMLKYHETARRKAIEKWISKRKEALEKFYRKNRIRMASLCFLVAFGLIADMIVIPGLNVEQFMSFQKITPKNLNRLSEDAFRKIIGYGYEEKIYVKDTAEIRSRMENSDMIFGDIQFLVKLISYELEIKFSEASPLFALMPQRSDSVPSIYSDKGKIYPYSANAAELPVVDAKDSNDVALATEFLLNMRENDILLYSRISQLIPSVEQRQITVFFNDVDFKTKFSLESDYWKTAFRYYRQLTRNMQVLNINSASVLDLRFKNMAYTVKKEERL